jgi:hypothetical protein
MNEQCIVRNAESWRKILPCIADIMSAPVDDMNPETFV